MKLSRLIHLLKYTALPALATLTLTGCFGGTVAQQLARSIFTHGADKATAAAMDAYDRNEKQQARYMVPNNTALDDYQIAFLRSGFEVIQPQPEPLPKAEPLPQAASQPESVDNKAQVSQLVSVEVWSLLVGEEKQRLLENAKLQGSQFLPPREEWAKWHVAIGSAENARSSRHSEPITFLIPPDIGKMYTGARAVVELPGKGELNIARYPLN